MVPVSNRVSVPVFLLVLASLIPQACSIIGLPFCFAMIKRYFLSVQGQAAPGTGRLTWFGSRGYFLMLLNVASFLVVCSLIFLVITLPGMILLLLHKVRKSKDSLFARAFTTFRKQIQGLMSCLWFTYFPFLEYPPVIRLDNQSSASLTRRKIAAAVAWVIA